MSASAIDVAVIGAGPAGATVSARLAQLGHRVVLFDRGRPRSHRSETLAPVTLDLLDLTGAGGCVRDAGFEPLTSMLVEWDGPRRQRTLPPGSLLVDRDRLDATLVDVAVASGVTVHGGVHVTGRRRTDAGWEIVHDGAAAASARFLVDATGRRSTRRRSRADALLGVTGRWEDASLDQPAVVALDNGWIWAAPLGAAADVARACEITVFVDPDAWHALDGDPSVRYTNLVADAHVVPRAARLVGSISARDASAALAQAVCGSDRLTVGDAALALDPLSSSGVQRSVQTALTAAVVAHTALTDPAGAAIALGHYRDTLARAAAHHVEWTSESYSAVAAVRPTAFWMRRATSVGRGATATDPQVVRSLSAGALVRRSPRVRFVEVSQVVGNTVRMAPAIDHPGLDGAVAFVGATSIVPLLAGLDRELSIRDLLERWRSAVASPTDAAQIVAWMLRTGALEAVG